MEARDFNYVGEGYWTCKILEQDQMIDPEFYFEAAPPEPGEPHYQPVDDFLEQEAVSWYEWSDDE